MYNMFWVSSLKCIKLVHRSFKIRKKNTLNYLWRCNESSTKLTIPTHRLHFVTIWMKTTHTFQIRFSIVFRKRFSKIFFKYYSYMKIWPPTPSAYCGLTLLPRIMILINLILPYLGMLQHKIQLFWRIIFWDKDFFSIFFYTFQCESSNTHPILWPHLTPWIMIQANLHLFYLRVLQQKFKIFCPIGFREEDF